MGVLNSPGPSPPEPNSRTKSPDPSNTRMRSPSEFSIALEPSHRPLPGRPRIARSAAEAVDDVEVPARIEPDVTHAAEHFPRLAVHDTDPEDLLEVGVEALVPAGEVDDFLGGERERGRAGWW